MEGRHNHRNKNGFSNFSGVVGSCFKTGKGRVGPLGSARHNGDSNRGLFVLGQYT